MEILVCLEGSTTTSRAIDVAIDLARSLPAGLVGLAIVDEPDIVAGAATSIGGAAYRRERDAELLDDAHRRARSWLARFLTRGRAARIAVRALAVAGQPAQAILAEVPRHDLTVIGRDVNFRFETQARDRYTRDRVLRRAARPIIVVPDPLLPRSRAVMIAYDGSPAAVRALHSLAECGLTRDRDVHVVTVADDGADAFEIASRGCELLAGLGVRAVPDNVVSSESTAGALLARGARIGAGLIAIGGYIPSPLARLVWGSVTHEVIERAAAPVFVHY
jgi:nucleotide-binding universal stress UspA family protein